MDDDAKRRVLILKVYDCSPYVLLGMQADRHLKNNMMMLAIQYGKASLVANVQYRWTGERRAWALAWLTA